VKKIITVLLLLALITSCKRSQEDNRTAEKKVLPTKIQVSTTIKKQQSHYFDTSFVSNKQKFNFIINDINEEEITLNFIRNSKSIKIDTLSSIGLGGFGFTDFNKDGNSDILLTYIGNNSSYELYLFDNVNNAFKKLEGFDKFSDGTQLTTNPKYYYSYNRAGCSDMNWESDLFYIYNFRTIQIGHIDGQGCNFEIEDNPQVLKFYKILDNNVNSKRLIKELPYLKNIPKFEDKWSFIEKYWNKNYGMYK
jgi:hypothetical protein